MGVAIVIYFISILSRSLDLRGGNPLGTSHFVYRIMREQTVFKLFPPKNVKVNSGDGRKIHEQNKLITLTKHRECKHHPLEVPRVNVLLD